MLQPLLRGGLWPLLPALIFLPMALFPPLNQDVAGVLQFSQRWLAGEHLYVDLIDVNPPLIFVLNLLPAAVAAVTPLDAVVALQVCLLAYGGLCWWLAHRARDRAAEGSVERALLDALPALFLFAAGYDFGQREHLMAMAALPYALVAARRARGEVPRGRLAVALLAGVAFALKPHFIGVPALVELYVLTQRRRLDDPVPWLIGGIFAVYLASLPLLFPAYLQTVLPLAWNLYRELGGATAWQVLTTQRMGTATALLLPLLWVTWRRRAAAPSAHLPMILALMAIAALVAAVAQHKGWSYHILPLQMFASALGLALAAQWLDRSAILLNAPRTASALAGLFALYALANGEAPWRELAYPHGEVASLETLLQRVSGQRVLALSPDVYPIYPALNYLDEASTLPAMSTWVLQASYATCLPGGRHYRDVAEMQPAERSLYREVIEDFVQAPPAAVLVDSVTGIPWCNGPFDFVDYFRRDPRFAQVWSRFHMAGEGGRFRLYTPHS